MDYITSDVESLDERAVTAANNDQERELLIEEFQPYLHGQVHRLTGSDPRNRDELFSYALMAFNEAIGSYQAGKGHFFAFADNVVHRRLIDGMRHIYRNKKDTVSLNDYDEQGEEIQNRNIIKASITQYQASQEQASIALEIEQFNNELENWDITMDMLVKQSPKHKALRKIYNQAVHMAAADPDIMQTIQVKRYFPVKKVSELTGIPQKKLERGRIYILASIIIQTGDFEYLSDYIGKAGD